MKLDLKKLKSVQEDATPGPWEYTLAESVENWFVLRDSNMEEISSGHTWSNPEGPRAFKQDKDFKFMATFNPQTVGALLDLLAEAEKMAEFYGVEGWNWHYCKKEYVKKGKCYAVSDQVNQDGGEIARNFLSRMRGEK